MSSILQVTKGPSQRLRSWGRGIAFILLLLLLPTIVVFLSEGSPWVFSQFNELGEVNLRVADGASGRVHTLRLPAKIYSPGTRDPLLWKVNIRNETGMPLTIAQSGASCSCSGVIVGASDLAPGDATEFSFQVHPDDSASVRSAQVRLQSESGAESWQYWMEAPLYPLVSFQRRRVQLGPLGSDARAEVPLILLAAAMAAESLPRLLSVESTNELLTIDTQQSEVFETDRGVVQRETLLTAQIDSGRKRGNFKGQIKARFHDPTSASEVEAVCDVSWSVPSLYTVSPARVFVGSVAEEVKPIERHVRITSRDVDHISIRSAGASHPAVSVRSLEVVEGNNCEVLITIDSESLDGVLWTEVLVETDNVAEPSVKVPVAAIA